MSRCDGTGSSHYDGENVDLPGQGFVTGLDEPVDVLERRERLIDFIGKPRVFLFRPFPDAGFAIECRSIESERVAAFVCNACRMRRS